jgi:glycerophosphoryl diester phosphodiesterase
MAVETSTGSTGLHFARRDRPLVWAHRGASRDAPENTMAAFQLAARQEADGVELDAQLCGSGEVVVLHDESLGRTTGFAGLIAETPWSVVRTLDAGARKDEKFRGERVPLLAEVLAQTPSALLVNVELKCDRRDDRGLTAATIAVIREARAEERVLLSSFNPLCLWRARRIAPRLPRALLFERDSTFALRHALSAPLLDLVALHPEDVLATPEAVRAWRRRGYLVAPWTVDDPGRAAELREAGATAIITNVPAEMLRTLAPAGPTSPIPA